MRYVSLFSGIEAASVAWHPLGWEPLAFSEIEPFPSAVLAHHYPGVPNLGDITKIDWSQHADCLTADLVVGGSPCQSFSIAGRREGLEGASGLMWEYVRAIQAVRPQWLVWENVPGALSSSGGEDFRCLLESLDELGYGLAWRVLDAQYFGVAQRRRRLYVVGSFGNTGAAEVLFELESLRWDHPTSQAKRQALTRATGGGAHDTDTNHGCLTLCATDSGTNSTIAKGIAPTLTAHDAKNASYVYSLQLSQTGAHGSNYRRDCAYTLDCAGPSAVAYQRSLRRLMPVECERLQGFPSIVDLELNKMTSDELIAAALSNHDIYCDFGTGKVYGTRGPGGIKLKEPKELGFLHPTGYVHISLHANGVKKQVRAHRVIYIAAYGAIPEGCVIDHINGVKDDNRLVNLQMMTGEGNSRKAKMDGAYLAGDDSPSAVISAEVRSRIVQEYSKGDCTYRQLAAKYGISKSRVGQLVKESGWTDVPYKGKEHAPDSPRYKALGNSMAVPVMRWIGWRIQQVEEVVS